MNPGNTGYRFAKRCAPVDHPVVEEPFWFSDDPAEHRARYGATTSRRSRASAPASTRMWDEARHIEIVAKVVEQELGGELGYGPWSLVWWWMQNEDDPLRRLTVTNCWAERDPMRTLRRSRREAAGMTRIAELCDYLQADERMHVRLATDWIRRLADADHQADLVRWGRDAVARIEASTPARNQARPPQRATSASRS